VTVLAILLIAVYFGTLYQENASQVRDAAQAFKTRIGQGSQFRCESEKTDAVICRAAGQTVRMVLLNGYWQPAD
jgi:hypothetical protein